MAQSAPATAQTIEAYVGETMDAARMGPIHWQVLALVASGRPKPCWVHRKDGIATKAPTRPAAWQSPKPEARALVGTTSEMKICEEFPASWMKKIIPNPIASTIPSLPALRTAPQNPKAQSSDPSLIDRTMLP